MYDHILVPTDGSEHASRAAEHGARLAEAFDATLHLLTVVDIEGTAGPFSAGGVDDAYVERRIETERETLTALEADLDASVATETAVETGRPSEGILDYVDAAGVDLIAMGTHGRRGLARYLTGSVAERVVRLSPVPVLTVRATSASAVDSEYDDILVPTDGSERADIAVGHALAIADAFGSTVHAVSVVNVGDIATGAETAVPPDLLDELEAVAGDAAEEIATAAEDAGLDAVTTVAVGRPKQELLSYVAESGIDLVCMGTHGRTGLNRVLLGSTAEALLRQADVPVLTVSQGQP